jgi:vesicle-fusing ATPase
LHALDEVHPAFGVSEEELEAVIQNGIIRYDNIVDVGTLFVLGATADFPIQELLRSGGLIVEQVRTSERAPVVNVLLHGPPGSGKTALAAAIAQASQFPFIKLITPDGMVGMGESQKISAITKVFMDSYKSPLSVVVVDNIERLIGSSSASLWTLFMLALRLVPHGRALLESCPAGAIGTH